MNEAQSALLDRIVTEQPDPQAWRDLVASCRADYSQHADLALTNLLGSKLSRVDRQRRSAVLAALADTMAGTEANSLATLLASDAEESARHLALEIVARWPGRLPRELLQPLRGLFLDRRLPESAQLQAAATLLASLGSDTKQAEDFLRTLVSGLGKVRSIERLRQLERRVGKSAIIDSLCERLEDRLRMSCPRCEVDLRRPEMQRHLWEAHKLLLVGRRVREPWSVVEEWIEAWRGGGPSILGERCRNLAQHLDAEQGLRRVNRMILCGGVDDAEARHFLLEEADEQHASLCPRCLAFLPVPREVSPWVLTLRGGRLSARGYLVDVDERGWRTRLEVRTPGRTVYIGKEPTYFLTPRGVLFTFVGPLVSLALLCAVTATELAGSTLSPVILFLSLAALAYGCVLWDLRDRPGRARLARIYAWTILAPRLLQKGYDAEDASFLAALASLEDSDEEVGPRARVLPALIAVLEQALTRSEGAPFHLAALYLRQVADEAADGTCPEDRIAALVGRCFEGKLPLRVAQHLLVGWRTQWHSPEREGRLRVLICDVAFEAGFEIRPLLEAGQTSPALGQVLRLDQPRELAALRLLWALRPARPWSSFGPVLNAFDLAADPAYEDLFGTMPDILFFQTDPGWPMEMDVEEGKVPFRIAVRTSGLMVQHRLFAEPPNPIRVRGRLEGCDLTVGEATFYSNKVLEEVGNRVKQWCGYFFTQFQPKLPDVLDWKSPEKAALLRAWGAVACPECGKPALPRLGKLAMPVGKEKSIRSVGA